MLIIEFILLLIFNSLIIQGLWHSSTFEWKQTIHIIPTGKRMRKEDIDMEYNMILWWVRFYSLKYIGAKWSKPIITCPTCMASLHSTYFYWLIVFPLSFNSEILPALVIYPMYILALAGLNTILISKTN